ncbi:hypothetical protein ARMSODRAFT_874976, partial [Armillaria solidipes]
MSLSIPGVTILSDTTNYFNSKNFTLWKLQITEILKGKGLASYLNGMITCPFIPTTTMSAAPPDPASTPIYFSVPSQDEWKFHDQLTHSYIVLNIIDPIGLEVKADGTMKECWDSI